MHIQTLEYAPHGGRTAVVRGVLTEEVAAQVEKAGVASLELNTARGWVPGELGPLERLTSIEHLFLVGGAVRDLSPVSALTRLRTLHLAIDGTSRLRIQPLPQLEFCALRWRPGAEVILECETLRYLTIVGLKSGDLGPLRRLSRLEVLLLVKATIGALRGIEQLSCLRELELQSCRQMRSLAGIEHLAELELLHLERCRGVAGLDALVGCRSLRTLHLSDCGPIASIRPLAGLERLSWLTFIESTNIEDGDLTVLE